MIICLTLTSPRPLPKGLSLGGCHDAGILIWRGASRGHGRQPSVVPLEVCVDTTSIGAAGGA